MFYIYGLREKGSDEYRYVGSTVDMQRRWWGHIRGIENPETSGNPPLYEWLGGLYGFEMDCLEEVAEDRRAKEERWINKLRGEGHRLFNIRSAAVMVIGIADMSNETKRGVVAQYLDKFGDDHDGPWMKEAKWVYIV
jgi:hypothetical protein